MKKYLPSSFLIAILFVFFNFTTAIAQTMEVIPEQETVKNFDVHITMGSRDFGVVETIQYDFGLNFRHGIYRYIPVVYQNGIFKRGIQISDLKILQDGKEQMSAKSKAAGDLNIKIGDPATTITGVHTYTISYRVLGAYNFFTDHDELYWNSTGNGWKVPIENTTTVIDLPQPLDDTSILTACFQGFIGAETKCGEAEFGRNADNKAVSVTFKSSFFDSEEGQTVVVGIPKGIIKLTTMDKITLFVNANYALFANIFIPIIVFAVMFALWWTRGRDPKGRATIIPEYEPPAGMTPIQLGTLDDFNIDNRDIAGEIIYLAEKGYIMINRLEDDSDFELVKTGKEYSSLPDYQRSLIAIYFPNNAASTKLKDLKSTIKKSAFSDLNSKVFQTLINLNYFKTTPLKMRGGYFTIAIFLIFVGFYFINTYTPAIILSAFFIGTIGYFMTTRTEDGVLAYQHIKGLELYIKVAEEKRIEFHNAPEKNPQHFEALLPYAMVLGLEKQWAKYFQDVNIPQPEWYHGNMTGFNAVVFTNQLSSFNSSAAAVVAATQASSGGSGFSGGSSGGGFGGGGGGSW